MTEEELNRIETIVRERATSGDIDSEPSLSLIALARVGLAFQNAIKVMDMTDQEFLLYCETHCKTERAGFVPQQIARLFRLAGYRAEAALWNKRPLSIITCREDAILPLVRGARDLLEQEDK